MKRILDKKMSCSRGGKEGYIWKAEKIKKELHISKIKPVFYVRI